MVARAWNFYWHKKSGSRHFSGRLRFDPRGLHCSLLWPSRPMIHNNTATSDIPYLAPVFSLPMSLCLSAQLDENQLRALNRREIQALAKRESIKPANMSTDKLIKRLLEKFFPAAMKKELGYAKPKPTPKKTNTSLRPQRKSARLATDKSPNPNKSVSVQISCAATTVFGPPKLPASAKASDPVTIAPPVDDASSAPPPPSTSHLTPAVADPIPTGTSASASVAEPPAPLFTPPQPAKPAHPTNALLRTFQQKVLDLNDKFVDVPSSLKTMERVLPRLERTAHAAKEDIKAFVWEGYYLQRDVVTMLKQEQSLWDGTNVMPEGPARDEWLRFLDDAAAEYMRTEALREGVTVPNSEYESDVSSTHQKRAREPENGVEGQPFKRHKEEGATKL
ncbi:hypothetical protein DFH07DRAFT_217448 [Mycena maculata]|uniref:Uncharacterized protein n=1 Tax=Mycena maculata TaxID=230809 RepID=A0AAD7NRR3_9AGAR|nr:hypothetical protein DFH07DRAFT_217448 [Mycena maculata]